MSMPSQPQPLPKLAFSVRETQIVSGASRETILAAIQSGDLPARRISPGRRGKYLIPRPALERWLGFPVDPAALSPAEPSAEAVTGPRR